jgi:hypothetical protein
MSDLEVEIGPKTGVTGGKPLTKAAVGAAVCALGMSLGVTSVEATSPQQVFGALGQVVKPATDAVQGQRPGTPPPTVTDDETPKGRSYQPQAKPIPSPTASVVDESPKEYIYRQGKPKN